MANVYVIEVLAVVLALYTIAYIYYGRRILHEKVVRASAERPTPAIERYDGVDYVPTNKYVLFGHHFASIAGAGPIVGPAIAMAYGWALPLLWVIFGNIFLGTVHDYLALMASVRYGGLSVMSVSENVMGRKARYVFLLYTFMALILVYAAFASVAASLFRVNPSAATMSILYMPLALLMGILMYRTGIDIRISTLVTAILVIGAFYYAYKIPIHLASGWDAYHIWVLVLGVYSILAASLPVWYLLQPRDYLNFYLLFTFVIVAVFGGLFMANKVFTAPSYTSFSPNIIAGQPTPFWPAIPLIIACGSLSGFHSLVASGTSSKQLASELDALFVGFGGMLTEGALSTFAVIIPISLAWSAPELVNMEVFKESILELKAVPRFTAGYGYMLGKTMESLGLDFASTYKFFALLASVALAMFVMTTLDTGTRLARFAWQEIFDWLAPINRSLHSFVTNRWVASAIVVLIGTSLAYPTIEITLPGGKTSTVAAYNVVWPAFAGVNQMLAALALLTTALWVYSVIRTRGAYSALVMVPAVFLWVTVTAGLSWWLIKVAPYGNLATVQRYGAGAIIAFSLVLSIALLILFMQALVRGKQTPGTSTTQ
ncbi:MAG: carbon starvation protein A [Desulfurococcales archaeon]|nr:carbon starvation protein A [Desulfurococcales archaeon]